MIQVTSEEIGTAVKSKPATTRVCTHTLTLSLSLSLSLSYTHRYNWLFDSIWIQIPTESFTKSSIVHKCFVHWMPSLLAALALRMRWLFSSFTTSQLLSQAYSSPFDSTWALNNFFISHLIWKFFNTNGILASFHVEWCLSLILKPNQSKVSCMSHKHSMPY